MPYISSKRVPPELAKLFDQYVHGCASRKDVLSAVAKFGIVGGMASRGLAVSNKAVKSD